MQLTLIEEIMILVVGVLTVAQKAQKEIVKDIFTQLKMEKK